MPRHGVPAWIPAPDRETYMKVGAARREGVKVVRGAVFRVKNPVFGVKLEGPRDPFYSAGGCLSQNG